MVTPTAELYSGLVDEVVAPGSEGDFGVLADHAPFMTTLAEGDVTIINEGKSRIFQVRDGFADVTPEGIIILAEHAQEYGENV